MDDLIKIANDSTTESDDHEDEEENDMQDEDEENRLGKINSPLGRELGQGGGKKKKPGIVFLSSVPEGMNVSQTTSFFSEFGRVGRVFLQPDKTDKKTGKYNRVFSEGWVEFMSKKVAKAVAENLNNNPVGGKRRSKSHDQLWNIKYLPRFKWVHLSERLAYESAVRQQRLRTEISQVKREAEHFKSSVEKKRRKSNKKEKHIDEVLSPAAATASLFKFKQRETEAQIRKRKREQTEDCDEEPIKKKKSKKVKKNVEHKKASIVPVAPLKVSKKAKSKKSKKTKDERSLSSRKSKESGDRSAFLKSVFGGGT